VGGVDRPCVLAGGPVEAAELHGTFDVGSTYTTKLKGWSPATATITAIQPRDLWTSVIASRGMTLTVDHVIQPLDSGTLLTERWTMTGTLAPLVRLLLGWRIRSTTEAATAHLARLAETRT
jgi:hypothetical protein